MKDNVHDDINLKYQVLICGVRSKIKLFLKTPVETVDSDFSINQFLSEMKNKLLDKPWTVTFVYSDVFLRIPDNCHGWSYVENQATMMNIPLLRPKAPLSNHTNSRTTVATQDRP